MDFIPDKTKKITLKALLGAPRIDRKHLKKFLLENYKIIPQEDRLIVWKIILGILF